MTDISNIARNLGPLNRYPADYLEVRLEESQNSHISYRGRELDSVDRSNATGGNVRALVEGRLGFVSFKQFRTPRGTYPASNFTSPSCRLVEKSVLAEVPPVVDTVTSVVGLDPVFIPLAQKKPLLDEYNEISVILQESRRQMWVH